MTTKRESSEDRWVADYMSKERRRSVAMGIGAVVAVALITVAILYYFANMAAVGW